MNKLITVILLAFLCTPLFSQSKFFKEEDKTRIMTEQEYENLKNVENYRLNKVGSSYEAKDSIVAIKMISDGVLIIINRYHQDKIKGNKMVWNPEAIFEMIDKELPDFTLKDINDKTYTLADFKGKPMLLNFWFSTCGPCKAEMPALNAIKEKYGDKVHFVSITFDPKQRIAPILEKIPFNFIHLINAKEYTKQMGLQGAPKNIFVDKNGVIRQIYDKVDDIYDAESDSVKRGEGKEIMKILDELLAE